MIDRLGGLLCLVLALGCAKAQTVGVAGTDDEVVDQGATQLEGLRAQAQAAPPACAEWCRMGGLACDVSKQTCEIAGRHPARSDLQGKCVAAQEDCSQYGDRCTSCSH